MDVPSKYFFTPNRRALAFVLALLVGLRLGDRLLRPAQALKVV